MTATATSIAKVKGGDEHDESCWNGDGSSKEEGQSMHFLSLPSLCNASTLQSMMTAGMGSSKTTTNMSVFDKNSKFVINAPKVPATPANVTATATTAGAFQQIQFYNSNCTDGSIVFKYRAKLQEQINNINQSQVGMRGDIAMFIGGSGGGATRVGVFVATIGVIAAVYA
eukprot:10732695-Ditylum_brightwellii.AAC.1